MGVGRPMELGVVWTVLTALDHAELPTRWACGTTFTTGLALVAVSVELVVFWLGFDRRVGFGCIAWDDGLGCCWVCC